MSGSRITRKVTVEVGKKVTESSVPSSVVQQSSSSSSSSNTRRSVFERLGPGAVERSKSRDTYTPDKCRNWLRDGRCPYGNNCKFLHGPYTDPKPRTKSVRSIVHSGSKDRYDDQDEKPYHSRSFDSADFDDDDLREPPKLKRRHKSEEDLSDSSVKKPSKSKKKHKEEVDEDADEGKIKRKRKTHRKREVSPKPQARSPNEDDEDYEKPLKNADDWEEHGDLDFERQLELERRRQDLQRQLALMDEEDAAASVEEKEDDQRTVPIIHSKLHPEPSPSTPDGETPTQIVKKKKKKKLDSEGKKTKAKKEASPKKKEAKHKASSTGDEEDMPKKEEPAAKSKVKKTVAEYAVSSDDADVTGHSVSERDSRRVFRIADESQPIEPHDSPRRSRPDERKRPEDDQIRHKREEAKPTKERRRVDLGSDDQKYVDEGRPHRPRDTSQDYYPSPDEQDDESRKVRSRVTGARRLNDPKRVDDGITDDRGRRRDTDSRGPRTPSPPPHAKDDRYYYDEQQKDSKKKRLPRGPPRSPPRESPRDETIHRKDSRGRPEDPHIRGPRTPSDDEARFSPPPDQADRGSRYAERDRGPPDRGPPDRGPPDRGPPDRGPPDRGPADRGPPDRGPQDRGPLRREPRDRVPVSDPGDQRFPDRGGRGNVDADYERRKPREEDIRGRRPPDYPRGRDDDYQKHRGRDDNYPRDNREDEFPRHREREEVKDDYQKGKYRDERPEDFPVRSRPRDDVEFPRGRGRGERNDEGRGRPPQRDVQRRIHNEPEGHERDIRDERDRPRSDYDSRGRYGGASDDYRRPSPSQGPPRGRSPPQRYEDRRRADDSFRSGPGGGRDPPGRGRAVGRGRSYTSPYDSRGKPVDTRRRSPPPPGPRSSYQDRDRGPPRGRDTPMGRGRGYIDKGRPPNDRYRDANAPWDRRGDRDYPPRDPAVRDRRPRESSPPPPPPPPAYRDERPWEERDRRESPSQRSGSLPVQEHRGQYDADHDGKGRMANRERQSLERGAQEWEYDDDAKPLRKRTRPIAARSESPFEAKKVRAQSPISPDEGPVDDDLPAEAVDQPARPKKAAVAAKDGKKIKKKKKEGKVAKAAAASAAVEGLAEPDISEESKIIKVEKKIKKEKKLKEKGAKKKKKGVVLAATAQVPPPLEDTSIQPVAVAEQTPPADQPKIGKKRKQAIATAEGDGLKEPEKPIKKKKKKKHQPEVLVQPWNDLEGDDDQEEEIPKDDGKPTQEAHTEKNQDEMFSDWSDDDSPVGEDSWLDEDSQKSTVENKEEPVKDSPLSDNKGHFDDVYDPISDDEFEAMYTQSDDEELKKDEKEASKALGVEDVDWSSLGISQDVNKEKEPVSHLERFTPSYVFSHIGISPTLAGQRLTQLVLDACVKPKDSDSNKGEQLCVPEEGPKCIGAFVAAAAAKKRERKGLLGNLGPCRRALCARRDLAIRKQLGRSSKFGKLSLFAASPTTPVDNELFQMGVALYKKESTNNDNGVRVIPSKVGSILLSQA